MDVDVEDGQKEEKTDIEYDMVALVTKKLLFSKRPMPVVKMVGAQT